MSGTRGSGVPTRSGPDALARVLDGMLSEGIHAMRHGMRLSSEAHPTALSNLVGMRCRAFPEIPLNVPPKDASEPVPQRMSGTRGSGVPTGSGPDALSRVLSGVI
jgi:hypothetical protein